MCGRRYEAADKLMDKKRRFPGKKTPLCVTWNECVVQLSGLELTDNAMSATVLGVLLALLKASSWESGGENSLLVLHNACNELHEAQPQLLADDALRQLSFLPSSWDEAVSQ